MTRRTRGGRSFLLTAILTMVIVGLGALENIPANLMTANPDSWPPAITRHPIRWMILTTVLLIFASLWVVFRERATRLENEASTEPSPEDLGTLADLLAGLTREAWTQEGQRRGITTTAPVAVAWRYGPQRVSLPLDDVLSRSVRGDGPTPIPVVAPGVPEASPFLPLDAGVITQLHTVYASLPNGSLVLVGAAGSGKTGALLLLLLAALDHRAAVSPQERQLVPVPIWLSLSDWNPARQSLASWVRRVLAQDYRAISAAGPNAVNGLLRERKVSLFLDGLDEMPPAFREASLNTIRQEAPGLRVVLTSRLDEYESALSSGYLKTPAVLELQPVDVEIAARYLIAQHSQAEVEGWQRLADQLTENPTSDLAKALNTPLALSLIRSAYRHMEPEYLLTLSQMTSVSAIRAHLLEQTVTAAFPDQATRGRAVRRLEWLAHHMGTTSELRWWQVANGNTGRRSTVITATVSTALLMLVLSLPFRIVWLMAGDHGPQLHPFRDAAQEMVTGGWAWGMAHGALAALLGSLSFTQGNAEPLSFVRHRPQWEQVRSHVRRRRDRLMGSFWGFQTFPMRTALWVSSFGLWLLIHDSRDQTTWSLGKWFSNSVFYFVFAIFSVPCAGAAVVAVRTIREILTVPLFTDSTLTPEASLRADRIATFWISIISAVIFFGTFVGFAASFGYWPLGSARACIVTLSLVGIPAFAGCFLGFGGPSVGLVIAACRAGLRRDSRYPIRLMTFLRTAHSHDLLRWSGASYQFRHAELQDWLARRYRDDTGTPAPEPGPDDPVSLIQTWHAPGRLAVGIRGLGFDHQNRLVIAGNDERVRLLTIGRGVLSELDGHRRHVEALAVDPGGEVFASGDRGGTILIWNSADQSVVRRVKVEKAVTSLAVGPVGDPVAASLGDRAARLWPLDVGQPMKLTMTAWPFGGIVRIVAIAPSGDLLAGAGRLGHVVLWDTQSFTRVRRLRVGWQAIVNAVVFSSDGSLIAAGDDIRNLHLWDTESGARMMKSRIHQGAVRAIAFVPGTPVMASGGDDRAIWFTDASTQTPIHRLTGHRGPINALAVSSDSRLLASADDEGSVLLWDISALSRTLV